MEATLVKKECRQCIYETWGEIKTKFAFAGQGFAFRRKQKAQHAYNKLLLKEKKANPVKTAFEHEYPEHLKHLYQAEADRLRKEDQVNQLRRRKAHPAEDGSVEDGPTSRPQSSSPNLPLPQAEAPESSTKYNMILDQITTLYSRLHEL